jgi:hypothetical protein
VELIRTGNLGFRPYYVPEESVSALLHFETKDHTVCESRNNVTGLDGVSSDAMMD